MNKDGQGIVTDAGAKEARARRHFIFLDQCRGVAIILVILCHCTLDFPAGLNATLGNPLGALCSLLSGKLDFQSLILFLVFYPCRLGRYGVAIFFVVSGFCIHLSYSQAAKPDLRGFYIRRFFRIYPPYLVAVIIFALFFPYSRLTFDKIGDWARLLTHLLLCHNLSDFFGCISASYWSIAVEAQLYLLFPVLLFLVRHYSFTRALILVGLFEFSLQFASVLFFGHPNTVVPSWLRTSPFFYWFSWSTGAAIADAYLNGKPLPFRGVSPVFWSVAGLATSGLPHREFSFSFFALATASILSRHLKAGSGTGNGSLLGRFLGITGTYSYSIYLIHHPILLAVVAVYQRLFPGIGNIPTLIFLAALSSLLITFPLSALMYYYIEKPGISLGKRVLRARSQRLARQSANIVTPTPARLTG